jgi:hypothetical protein
MNLAVNARDAMPEAGRLAISVDRREIGPNPKRRSSHQGS